ncbi:hypothetical protein AB0940_33570 [Streptomyces sp. NPDC006656]|uniref:hypothetical protein n=1 Tax=Streptomyces sp. NPDC006656 TaxID=3156899 RepID=UPI003454FD7B
MRQPDPEEPAPDWRALLAALPAGDDEPPPGTSRRRWRRTRRRAAREQRAAAVTAVRSRPVHPAALLLVVLLVLALGVLDRCGGRPGGSDDRPPTRPSHTPTAAPAPPPAPSVPAGAGPDDVAAAWTRAYLSRDPLADQTHRASVRRAAAWATEDLTRNLTEHAPPRWGQQVSRGEITRVTGVVVRPADPGLPPDNEAQVWRTVTATIDVTGYERSRRADTLSVELTRTTSGWRVSRVLGV